ncbi:universal stress protein UspA and related nucleotide-binding protein [Candidatus Scalindua japonica]|uniref:Universal stress protein UspA and related nucleotide-binding protein n=1 Tax=Candidatus Scalindua japonica TaxID=1284222 RepID=A0A286U4H2_9BACT|nr:universal stress protein [Candidatus Scalindua japonica]GAX63025.1 universal stress protein UspA and related nucleotide-binding protein [Candidatus Scalindua japonica]
MKIILAVDGSKNSEWAVDFLLKIPLAEMPQISVLQIVPEKKHMTPFLDSVYHKLYKDTIQEKIDKDILSAETLTTRIAEQLRSRWNHIESIIEKGQVSDKIIERAKGEKADLIILGSRGLSKAKSFFLGGVSQKVTTYAPCSVLVVKKKISTFKRVLIATDGSHYSNVAVKFLKSCFLTKEFSTTLLNVWDSPVILPQFAYEAIGEKRLKELHKMAFLANALCVEGDPAEMINDIAQRRKVNLVIVGSKGLTGNKRFLLGSVARKVVTYNNSSVLVVKSIDKPNMT